MQGTCNAQVNELTRSLSRPLSTTSRHQSTPGRRRHVRIHETPNIRQTARVHIGRTRPSLRSRTQNTTRHHPHTRTHTRKAFDGYEDADEHALLPHAADDARYFSALRFSLLMHCGPPTTYHHPQTEATHPPTHHSARPLLSQPPIRSLNTPCAYNFRPC